MEEFGYRDGEHDVETMKEWLLRIWQAGRLPSF
jgi:hypothetical protein